MRNYATAGSWRMTTRPPRRARRATVRRRFRATGGSTGRTPRGPHRPCGSSTITYTPRFGRYGNDSALTRTRGAACASSHCNGPEMHAAPLLMEATDRAQLLAEVHELLERLVDGLRHEVERHVVRRAERLFVDGPRRATRGCAHPTLSVGETPHRELLGHVIELMPFVVRAVLGGVGDLGEREESDLDLVHAPQHTKDARGLGTRGARGLGPRRAEGTRLRRCLTTRSTMSSSPASPTRSKPACSRAKRP